MYVRSMFRFFVLIAGGSVAAFLALPLGTTAADRLRSSWRHGYTLACLAAACLFFVFYIVTFGRWQFGAFDHNILIDLGWRQFLGQRPYVDFITSTPPGFNLGIKFAFEVFGPSWNAGLYLAATFACVTFLWLYWLLTQLELTRWASFLVAFALEVVIMLSLSFWWYNNSAFMLAVIFFLSCLLYIRRGEVGWSYAVSLALLVLMKPNIAGLMVAGGFPLTFLATDRKLKLLLLTAIGTVGAVAILLVNHISIPAMIASYHGASLERGAFAAYAFHQMNPFARRTALLWALVLSLPLLLLLPQFAEALRRRDWRRLAYLALFPLAAIVALYGIAGNGELPEINCAVLIAAGAVATLQSPKRLLRRIYVAGLIGVVLGDLFLGAERVRVYNIGHQKFFEWSDNRHLVASGFLKGMRVTGLMEDADREIALAKAQTVGPWFFGPRIDYSYAVLGITPPDHLPSWWHPGTAFASRDVPHILDVWQAHHFETLIFLKDDYTLYPPEFMSLLATYTRDDSYPGLTVYRLHPGFAASDRAN